MVKKKKKIAVNVIFIMMDGFKMCNVVALFGSGTCCDSTCVFRII